MKLNIQETFFKLAEYETKQGVLRLNEATRADKCVVTVLQALTLASLETERKIEWITDGFNSEGKRPDFILFDQRKPDKSIFYIIEVKSQAGEFSVYEDRLKAFMMADQTRYGCLTDGIAWHMYTIVGEELQTDDNFFLKDIQLIVDYIFDKAL
jgi:hypothetical protein